MTELRDNVRIPLHTLQADLDYLIGRVIADGASVPAVIESIRGRLNEIEAAVMPCKCLTCSGTGTIPARDGVEARYGENDTFPGDPYPCGCNGEIKNAHHLPDLPQTVPERAPLRQCSYCKTWNSKPCGEQCCWSPTDPVYMPNNEAEGQS